MKRRKNRPTTPEYCDVYAPRASYVSVHSYAEVGAGPSYVTVQSYADIGKRSSYISVHSYADVGTDSSNETEYANVAVQTFAISRQKIGTEILISNLNFCVVICMSEYADP